jgi:lipoyl-dependent peroxiredoxin
MLKAHRQRKPVALTIAQKHRCVREEVLARMDSWLELILMTSMMRNASVQWTGGSSHGSGEVTTESGVLQQARYCSGTALKMSNGTNPAELIAAAQASSFSMTLAQELGAAGFVPNHIDTIATVTLERLAAGWTISNINLKVLAEVPKASQGNFIDATLRAKLACPVSRLLRANVSMNAKLERNAPVLGPPRSPPKRKPAASKDDSSSRKSRGLQHL